MKTHHVPSNKDPAFFYSPQGAEEFKIMAEKYCALVTATPERAKQELIALGVLNLDGSKSINYFPDGV
jgi:hypothetical protein